MNRITADLANSTTRGRCDTDSGDYESGSVFRHETFWRGFGIGVFVGTGIPLLIQLIAYIARH